MWVYGDPATWQESCEIPEKGIVAVRQSKSERVKELCTWSAFHACWGQFWQELTTERWELIVTLGISCEPGSPRAHMVEWQARNQPRLSLDTDGPWKCRLGNRMTDLQPLAFEPEEIQDCLLLLLPAGCSRHAGQPRSPGAQLACSLQVTGVRDKAAFDTAREVLLRGPRAVMQCG